MNTNFTNLDTILKSGAGIRSATSAQADTATKLTTARTINGTSFNGTANITTANWGSSRSFSITDGTNTGDTTSVNGSGNVSLRLPTTIVANLQYSGIGGISPTASPTAIVSILNASDTLSRTNRRLYIGHNTYKGELSGSFQTNTAYKLIMQYSYNSTYYIIPTTVLTSPTRLVITEPNVISENSDIYLYYNASTSDVAQTVTTYATTLTLSKSIQNWYVI